MIYFVDDKRFRLFLRAERSGAVLAKFVEKVVAERVLPQHCVYCHHAHTNTHTPGWCT